MPVSLNLYTRAGCHLCEDMEQVLSEQAQRLDMLINIIPIDNNPGLEKVYGSRVPVLMHADIVVCETFLDPVALNEAVARYAV